MRRFCPFSRICAHSLRHARFAGTTAALSCRSFDSLPADCHPCCRFPQVWKRQQGAVGGGGRCSPPNLVVVWFGEGRHAGFAQIRPPWDEFAQNHRAGQLAALAAAAESVKGG